MREFFQSKLLAIKRSDKIFPTVTKNDFSLRKFSSTKIKKVQKAQIRLNYFTFMMFHFSSEFIFFSYGGKHAAKFEKSTTICIPCPEFCVKMGKIGLAAEAAGK